MPPKKRKKIRVIKKVECYLPQRPNPTQKSCQNNDAKKKQFHGLLENDGSVTARLCGLMGSFNRHASHDAQLNDFNNVSSIFIEQCEKINIIEIIIG